MLERRRGPPRVKFEKPLEAWIVAVDHTCIGECQVIELSHRGAQLRVPASAVGLERFLLVLSRFGCPVYRHCERKWVDGSSMGVEFRGHFRTAPPKQGRAQFQEQIIVRFEVPEICGTTEQSDTSLLQEEAKRYSAACAAIFFGGKRP